MPQETFEHLVSQLERLDFKGRISLYGINEPLMDPMLAARVRALRDACPRAYLTIDTNGDLLSHAAIADLEAAGLDSIIVNAYDTPALRRMSKFADAPIVSLRDSRNKDDEVENRGGSILRKSHLFDTKKVADRNCRRPSTALQINAEGNVVLCCGDMYGDVVFGNVMECDLLDIWHSDKMNQRRRALRENGRKGLSLCDGCSHDGTASLVVPFLSLQAKLKNNLKQAVPSKLWSQ